MIASGESVASRPPVLRRQHAMSPREIQFALKQQDARPLSSAQKGIIATAAAVIQKKPTFKRRGVLDYHTVADILGYDNPLVDTRLERQHRRATSLCSPAPPYLPKRTPTAAPDTPIHRLVGRRYHSHTPLLTNRQKFVSFAGELNDAALQPPFSTASSDACADTTARSASRPRSSSMASFLKVPFLVSKRR